MNSSTFFLTSIQLSFFTQLNGVEVVRVLSSNAGESDRVIITFIADRFSRQKWSSEGMKRSLTKARAGEKK